MSTYQSQYNLNGGDFDVLTFAGATPNLPVVTDGDGNLATSQIDLKTQVAGVLPTASGGTGSAVALTNGKLMVSAGNAIVEGTSATSPTFTDMTLSGLGINSVVTTDAAKKTVSVPYTLHNNPNTIVSRGFSGEIGVGSIDTEYGYVRNALQLASITRDPVLWIGSKTKQIVLAGSYTPVTVNVPGGAQATTVTMPDSGTPASNFVLSEGAQTLNGSMTLAGTTNLAGLTASRPLQLDGSKNIVAAPINLAGGAGIVSGVLPQANGGSTGSNTGDVTLAPVGSAPNANGASIAGQVLTLQPADSTNPGVVTAGSQTFGGLKTFATLASDFLGLLNPSNQIGFSGANTTFINVPSPSGNRQVTLPDAGTYASSFVLTAGAQSIGGDKTLTGTTTHSGMTTCSDRLTCASDVYFTGGSLKTFDCDAAAQFVRSISQTLATDSTAPTNGAAAFSGGVGINKRLNVGGLISAAAGVKLGNYARRTNSANIALGAGAATPITFDTAIAASGISYAGGVFTLPVAGMYVVSWSARLTGIPAVEIDMILSCSQDSAIQNGNTTFGPFTPYASVCALIYTTAANQTVTPYIYKASGALNLAGSVNYNVITIQLVNTL